MDVVWRHMVMGVGGHRNGCGIGKHNDGCRLRGT